jgi:hypothetical protein
MVNPLTDVVEMTGYFFEIATGDPVNAVFNVLMMLVGNLIMAGAIIVFFGLAAAGVVSALLPEQVGRAPPQERGE